MNAANAKTLLFSASASAALLILAGCGSSGDDTASGGGGNGGSGNGGSGGSGASINIGGASGASTGGSGGVGGGPTCDGKVLGVFRDFRSSHPDFECTKDSPYVFDDPYNKDCGPWDPAIVGALGTPIGTDRKPVFAGGTTTVSTTTPQSFDEWFNDVPGVNASKQDVLELTRTTQGTLIYDTDRFFPLDGELFDAEANNPDTGPFIDDDGNSRNFHFTYELHTTFKYQAGNVFTFRGDDDVFVYINDKLAVNIGGIHVPLQGRIDLDTGRVEITAPLGFPNLDVMAALGFDESIAGGVAGTVDLGLTAGEIYAMDFFFAERNCCASNFRLETNFEFVDCGIVK